MTHQRVAVIDDGSEAGAWAEALTAPGWTVREDGAFVRVAAPSKRDDEPVRYVTRRPGLSLRVPGLMIR